MNKTPLEHMLPVRAFEAQAIGTTAVTGDVIVNPWLRYRYGTLVLTGAAFGATDALTTQFQVRRVGTSTFDDIQANGGSADLDFNAADVSDGGAIENGAMAGTIDLVRLREGDGFNLPKVGGTQYEYDAIRTRIVNANNSSPPIIGGVWIFTHPITLPGKTFAGAAIDNTLLLKQLPYDLS